MHASLPSQIAPELEALHAAESSRAHTKVAFYKVDVDQSRDIAAEAGVKSMPTLHFFKNGKRISQIVGADIAALRDQVRKATQPAIMRALRSEILAMVGVVGIIIMAVLMPMLQLTESIG